MTTRPELHEAIAGQKSKASEYNDNFDKIMDYVEDSLVEQNTEVATTLSIYQTVNTLATSGTITLTDNSINTIIPQGAVTFALPTITGEEAGKFHQILVQAKLTNASYVSAANTRLGTSNYFNQETPIFTTGTYDIMYEYDNINGNWVVGILRKGNS